MPQFENVRRSVRAVSFVRNIVIVILALVSAALAVAVAAQQGRTDRGTAGTCTLTGVAVDDSGAPLKGVLVKLDQLPSAEDSASLTQAAASGARPLGWLPPPGDAQAQPPARPLGFLPAPGAAPNEVETDDSGRFQFDGLPTGRFRITVRAPAGLVLAARTRMIDVAPGASTSVVLRLERTGAITGRLLANGKALADGDVRLMQWGGPIGGPRRLVPVPMPGIPANRRGPNGEFGFADLLPGEYFLVGSYQPRQVYGDSASGQGLVPTYYPGTTELREARPVTVRAGQATSGVDFPLVRARRSAVQVKAADSHGNPLPRPPFGRVELRQASDAHPASMIAAAPSVGAWRAGDGKSVLRNVPAGDYFIVATLYTDQDPGNGQPARVRTGGGQSLWEAESGYLPLTVKEGEDPKVEIRTNVGARIAGRVLIEDGGAGSASRAAGPVVVTARPAGVQLGSPASTPVRDDGTFELAGLRGPVVLVAQTRGVMKSVTVAGRDVTGKPLMLTGTERLTDVALTVTTNTARVEGAVEGADAHAVLVVAFPDDPARCQPGTSWVRVTRIDWRSTPELPTSPAAKSSLSRTTAPRPASFAIGSLLPGRYLIAAIEERSEAPVFDAEMLDRLRPLATTVTLAAGETGKVELRVVSPAPR